MIDDCHRSGDVIIFLALSESASHDWVVRYVGSFSPARMMEIAVFHVDRIESSVCRATIDMMTPLQVLWESPRTCGPQDGYFLIGSVRAPTLLVSRRA